MRRLSAGNVMTQSRSLPVLFEHYEQKAVVDWAGAVQGRYPELRWLYAIPNAAKRSVVTASIMKAQGMKSGVPDLCLPVARKGYHGLYIEMKKKKNSTTSDNQREWIEGLYKNGYMAVICKGADEAIKTIEWYLEI